jgi:hypothetical protein
MFVLVGRIIIFYVNLLANAFLCYVYEIEFVWNNIYLYVFEILRCVYTSLTVCAIFHVYISVAILFMLIIFSVIIDVTEEEEKENKNQQEIYPMGHCRFGLMPQEWWHWGREDGNPVMLDPIRYSRYMTGASYLAARDATNRRQPGEDDISTGSHFPLYAERGMHKSSRLT